MDTTAGTINEVWWVGGGAPVTGFTVRFYTGLAAAPDSQPTISNLPENETPADYLKGYTFAGNANETALDSRFNQYHVTLPQPLDLQGNTVYWIKIEADIEGYPFWGLATATHGRDVRHVSYFTGLAQFLPGASSGAFDLRGTFATPEPGSLAALGLGTLLLLRRRRR